MGIRELGEDVLALVYPRLCEICDRPLVRGEKLMCLHCRLSLPQVRIADYSFNELHRRLAAPGVLIENAASYFEYHKDGDYAKLIHQAKYHGRPGIGRQLAREFAGQLMKNSVFFDGMDVIVPVPIHPFKRMRRGYNQTEFIARGLGDVIGLKVDAEVLKTTRTRTSQTRKSVFERWVNTIDSYVADADRLHGVGGVLLVDDVITSGSTLLSCAKALMAASPALKISVVTLGMTCD